MELKKKTRKIWIKSFEFKIILINTIHKTNSLQKKNQSNISPTISPSFAIALRIVVLTYILILFHNFILMSCQLHQLMHEIISFFFILLYLGILSSIFSSASIFPLLSLFFFCGRWRFHLKNIWIFFVQFQLCKFEITPSCPHPPMPRGECFFRSILTVFHVWIWDHSIVPPPSMPRGEKNCFSVQVQRYFTYEFEIEIQGNCFFDSI